MRLASLLCFYDEDPALLAGSVASLALTGAEWLVALDGAYADYPGAQTDSPWVQREAIARAAQSAGVRLVIESPGALFASEMEKRSRLFRVAQDLTRADWFLVLDADEAVVGCPADLAARLDSSLFDVVRVPILETPSPILGAEDADGEPFAMGGRHVKHRRSIFRNLPGLHVAGRHDRYFDGSGRCLWGDYLWGDEEEPALRLSDFVIDHRRHLRSAERLATATSYYAARDAARLESLH